jgi:hypothetical protein
MSNEKPFKLDMGFAEALKRFVRTDPKEVDDAFQEHHEKRKRVKRRIEKAREEIDLGAESGKPKFRL